MTKSVESTQHEFGTVRTGRASPALLDRIVVDYYGAPTPLQAAGDDPRAGGAAAHRPALRQGLDQGDREGDHGVRRRPDAQQRRQLIRLASPSSTRSAAASWSRSSAHIAEEGRVAIRNIRRDVMHDLRELKEAGEAGADDERRAEVELQKLTDAAIAELDAG